MQDTLLLKADGLEIKAEEVSEKPATHYCTGPIVLATSSSIPCLLPI